MKAYVNIIGKKVSMSKIKVSLVKLLLHEAYNESMCQYYKRESFIVKPKGIGPYGHDYYLGEG
jgi:hypothetical protein